VKLRSLSKSRWFPFAIVLAIVFIPAAAVVTTLAADRLGYCVNDILPGDTGLNVDPYVQDIGTTSASIVWRTTTDREATLRYGVDGSERVVTMEPAEIQVATLTDLEPDTTYTYTVERETIEFDGAFTTAPEAEGSVRFAALGDSGTGGQSQYDVAGALAMAEPDVVLHTGDVVYRRGALCHYGTKYFAPYRSLIANVPVYPAIGNHDLMAKGGEAYFDTFVLPQDNAAGTEEYYAFDYGPVNLISISSEFYEDDDETAIAEQRAWLETELANGELPWTIVLLHRSPFSSTDGKDSDDVRDDLTPIFAEYGVDLVLSGHAHNYERSVPIDGVTYIITGGGGAGLRGVDPSETTAVAVKAHHFVQIDASPDTLSITAIDKDSQVIDQVELTGDS
jgi:3',5'-cyclic AMP phosphodiesterase CpdA